MTGRDELEKRLAELEAREAGIGRALYVYEDPTTGEWYHDDGTEYDKARTKTRVVIPKPRDESWNEFCQRKGGTQ